MQQCWHCNTQLAAQSTEPCSELAAEIEAKWIFKLIG